MIKLPGVSRDLRGGSRPPERRWGRACALAHCAAASTKMHQGGDSRLAAAWVRDGRARAVLWGVSALACSAMWCGRRRGSGRAGVDGLRRGLI
jgi:hypothetical protein